MEATRLLTLHAPMGRFMSKPLLSTIEEVMKNQGVKRWWISHQDLPDIVIMAELPSEMIE